MWRKVAVAGLALGSIPGLGTQAAPHPERSGQVALTVSLFNDAGVPQDVLSRARTRAESVMADAGLALTWLNCGTPGQWVADLGCSEVTFPTHLSVRLAKNGSRRSGDVFGESFLDDQGRGSYAIVYLAPVISSPAARMVDRGDLLGYVITHEIGHLLLGAGSHSGSGIMHGVWEFADLEEAARGRLRFQHGESRRLQARLLSYPARQEVQASRTVSGK